MSILRAVCPVCHKTFAEKQLDDKVWKVDRITEYCCPKCHMERVEKMHAHKPDVGCTSSPSEFENAVPRGGRTGIPIGASGCDIDGGRNTETPDRRGEEPSPMQELILKKSEENPNP